MASILYCVAMRNNEVYYYKNGKYVKQLYEDGEENFMRGKAVCFYVLYQGERKNLADFR